MSMKFEDAVAHAMKYEVGAFNPADPEVIAGLISTPAQRKKVGYVNDPADKGGETKFGVAATANPGVKIATLTWPQAVEIYRAKYWMAGGCHLLNERVALIHFDGCVNHGVGRASRFLQQIAGVPQDGQVGQRTATALASLDPIQVCNSLAARREQFYQDIVISNPSQAKFLKGWIARINDIRAVVTKPTF
jgi:lysozyme family protein